MTALMKSIFMLKHHQMCPNALLRVLNPNCAMINGCRDSLTFPTTMSRLEKDRASCVTNIAFSGQLVHFVIQRRQPNDSRGGKYIVRFRRRQFSMGSGHVRVAHGSLQVLPQALERPQPKPALRQPYIDD